MHHEDLMIKNMIRPVLYFRTIYLVALIIGSSPEATFAQVKDLELPGIFKGKEGGPGRVRIQGRDRKPDEPAPTSPAEELIDFRDEMRKFIQSISQYARQKKPGFIIIVQDGLDLLIKRDDIEETNTSPARTYIRSIDGILAQGLFLDIKRRGQPTPTNKQTTMLDRVATAKRSGLKIFTLDVSKNKSRIDTVTKKSLKLGYIPLISDLPFDDISSLPDYPTVPSDENAGSILSLSQVKNFAVIANSQAFGQESEFALKMHDNNYDMVVVDIFHRRKPLSRQAVETLKYKKVGAKRLALAQIDIGSAASSAYYWRNNWGEGFPLFINAPLREDPDRYNVEFWRPGWQKLISGNTDSYVYGLIAQGFDGALLKGADAIKFFEGEAEGESD